MVMFSPVADPIWTPPKASVPLTLSGNEITPYVRRFGKEGDGLNPNDLLGKYSIAPYEATTNILSNGAFGTNTTGWSNGPHGTLTRVTAASEGIPKMFGDYVGKYVFDGLGQGGPLFTLTFGATTTYTLSAWVYIPATFSGASAIGLFASSLSDDSDVDATAATLTASGNTGRWIRIQRTILTGADTSGSLAINGDTGTPAAGATFYICGVQVEAQPLATPYVHTDGGTASRSAANPALPAFSRYFSISQGWVAIGWRQEWPNANEPLGGSSFPFVLSIRDDDSNRVIVYYSETNNRFEFTRNSGGAGSGPVVSRSLAVGDLPLLIVQLSPSALGMAVDGSSFTSAANTSIPTLTATSMDIGHRGGALHYDFTKLFLATGRNPLTDANSKAIDNIFRTNRIDSRPEDLPGGCTAKWPPADGDVSRMLVAA